MYDLHKKFSGKKVSIAYFSCECTKNDHTEYEIQIVLYNVGVQSAYNLY